MAESNAPERMWSEWKTLPAWKWLVVLLAVFAIYEVAKPGVNLHGAPEVRGLTLPAAEQLLRQKGYTADVHTNALFGVIIPQHFYVCSESAPQGKLVVVDAEKQC